MRELDQERLREGSGPMPRSASDNGDGGFALEPEDAVGNAVGTTPEPMASQDALRRHGEDSRPARCEG